MIMSRRRSSVSQQQQQQYTTRRVSFEEVDVDNNTTFNNNNKPPATNQRRFDGVTTTTTTTGARSTNIGVEGGRTGVLSKFNTKTTMDPSSVSILLRDYSKNNSRRSGSGNNIRSSSANDPSAASTTTITTTTTTTTTAAPPPPPPSILKKNPVTVLHGRVMKQQQQQQPKTNDASLNDHNKNKPKFHVKGVVFNDHPNRRRSLTQRFSGGRSFNNNSSTSMDCNNNRHSSTIAATITGGTTILIRNILERNAVYTQLLEETKEFETQVLALEHLVKDNHHHEPVSSQLQQEEGAMERQWRVRLLLKKAQDTDTIVWKKLYDYEKTLNEQTTTITSTDDIRELQTACIKLHRDFNRSHKILLMCMSLVQPVGVVADTTTTTRDTGSSSNDYTPAYGRIRSLHNNDNTMEWNGTSSVATTTTPIVESVGWSNRKMSFLRNNRSTGTNDIESSNHPRIPEIAPTRQQRTIGKHSNNNNWIDRYSNNADEEDEDTDNGVLLSRSISPTPVVYTSFRPQLNNTTNHHQNNNNKSSFATIQKNSNSSRTNRSNSRRNKYDECDDGIDDYGDNNDPNNNQDDFYDSFTTCFEESKFCDTVGSRSSRQLHRRACGGGGKTTTLGDSSTDPSLADMTNTTPFWICGVFDLRDMGSSNTTDHQQNISIETVGNDTTKNSNFNGEEEYKNDNDTTVIDDTEYDERNDNASYKSSQYYEKWYKQLQDNLHSMQLDLLHFRSSSSFNANGSNGNYYHTTASTGHGSPSFLLFPEYSCGGGNGGGSTGGSSDNGDCDNVNVKSYNSRNNNTDGTSHRRFRRSDDVRSDAPLDEY